MAVIFKQAGIYDSPGLNSAHPKKQLFVFHVVYLDVACPTPSVVALETIPLPQKALRYGKRH